MSNGAAKTEERLRTWLDSNHAGRERLCAGLLALQPDYTQVQPRRPKGGPDGARDIEAVYKGQTVVFGAVGFRNGPRDSADDKRWVKNKFRDDLAAAVRARPSLKGFVFFTNVDLTPTELAQLHAAAADRGLEHLEVFFRERLRMLLDAPEALGLRFQHLGIELSAAEQTAFFDRFGSALEGLITGQFAAVERQLARNEFLHECRKKLRMLVLVLDLSTELTPESIGHFRAMISIMDLDRRDPHPTLCIGCRDAYLTSHHDGRHTAMFGTKVMLWSSEPDGFVDSTIASYGQLAVRRIVSERGLFDRGPFKTVADLEYKAIRVHVTKALLPHVAGIGLVANDYVVFYEDEELVPNDGEPTTAWPEELTDAEKAVPWATVMLKGPNYAAFQAAADSPDVPPFEIYRPWDLDFSLTTPRKLGTSAP